MKQNIKPQSERKGTNPEQTSLYAEKLSRMVQCKTVWTHEGENEEEFRRFYARRRLLLL